MSEQTVITTPVLIDGAPHTVRLVNNPTVDDVLVGEMFAQATSIWRGDDLSNHRVERGLRNYLIILGVER
jgi:hypothetical protein